MNFRRNARVLASLQRNISPSPLHDNNLFENFTSSDPSPPHQHRTFACHHGHGRAWSTAAPTQFFSPFRTPFVTCRTASDASNTDHVFANLEKKSLSMLVNVLLFLFRHPRTRRPLPNLVLVRVIINLFYFQFSSHKKSCLCIRIIFIGFIPTTCFKIFFR